MNKRYLPLFIAILPVLAFFGCAADEAEKASSAYNSHDAAPTVNAGENINALVGKTVILQGSATDPEGKPPAYSWELTSKPTDSTTTDLQGKNTATPTLYLDKAGSYVAKLTANDGNYSASDSVTVTAVPEGFVFIQGGCFDMGNTFNEGDDDEKPVHTVCLDDFYLAKYETTQGDWQRIMGSNPSSFKNGDDYPVERVSWNDVQQFIEKFNDQTDGKYRLPTEAEWEYACRERGEKVRYGMGKDTISYSDANYYRNVFKTTPVGSYAPNALGLYDMSGNLWEWVSDWYDSDYYKNSPKNNPQASNTGSFRVVRGGSWNSYPRYLRCASRDKNKPSDSGASQGFRLAWTL